MAFLNRSWIIIAIFLSGVFWGTGYCQNRADSLLQSLKSGNNSDRYEICRQLVLEYYYADPVKASKYSEEALQMALQSGDKNKLADAYHTAGSCRSRADDLPTALKYYNRALDAYKKAGDDEKKAFVENDIAWVNTGLKRYEAAMEIYTRLLSYYYNKSRLDKYCSILNNMGSLLLDKKDYSEALEKFSRIMELYPKTGNNDKGFIAVIYCNLGEAYYGMKDYAASYKYRKLSLNLFTELKNSDGVANLQMDIGESLMKLKDFGQAKNYLCSALHSYRLLNYAEGERKTKEKIAVLYKEMNQFDKALENCGELEKMSEAAGDSAMLAKCYYMYADLYYTLKRNEFSALYYRKYTEIKEALNTKDDRQRMAELQALFEMEEKEFENKTLKHENEIQKERLNAKEYLLLAVSAGVLIAAALLFWLYRKETKIKKINKDIRVKNIQLEEHLIVKDKFFSILAHNLKNPFWAILSQNELLSKGYDDLSDEEKRALINNIGSSAVNVYQLFEDLLKWAKSQQSGIKPDIQPLSLGELIRSSVKPYEIFAQNKSISFEIIEEGDYIINGDRFMLETVIGNLVHNAIKYSDKESKIILRSRRVENELEISVEDSGIGLSQDKADKLFKLDENVSSAGTLNEKGTGFGLLICKEFVDKHGGRIVIDSRPGEGSVFRVMIPLTNNQERH